MQSDWKSQRLWMTPRRQGQSDTTGLMQNSRDCDSTHKTRTGLNQKKKPNTGKGKWTQCSTPNREAICNEMNNFRYSLQIRFLQRSVTESTNHTSWQAPHPGAVDQHKIDSMILVFCLFVCYFCFIFLSYLFWFWVFVSRGFLFWERKKEYEAG